MTVNFKIVFDMLDIDKIICHLALTAGRSLSLHNKLLSDAIIKSGTYKAVLGMGLKTVGIIKK
jgi:hypothetical protein